MKITYGLGDIPARFGIITGSLKKDLADFFASKGYGLGCAEIHYSLLCINKEYDDAPRSYTFYEYKPRAKRLEVDIDIDYKLASACKTKGEYLALFNRTFFEQSQKISELGIKDFDHDKYLTELKQFLQSYFENFSDRDQIIENKTWI